MSKFIFKPEYVDMGFEPSTKTVKFIHESTYDISLHNVPSWLTASVDYDSYSGGTPSKGTITLSVGYDIGQEKVSGVVEVWCDLEKYYIPVIYSYTSDHIPVKSVVDNVILSNGDNSYISNRDRIKATLAAKRWVQDHPFTAGTYMRFAELPIVDGKVKVPSDYMDYIALYSHTLDGYLLPIYFNNDMNIASSFLQDDEHQYILDSNGFAISVSGLTPRPSETTDITLPYDSSNSLITDNSYSGFNQTYNIRSGFLSKNGMYRYIPEEKCFIVSNVQTDNIVLQYVSDPILADKMKLELGELSIHKYYQEALEAYIYYTLIKQNRSVRLYDKNYARQEYKLAMKRCERRKLKLSELIQVISGTNPI